MVKRKIKRKMIKKKAKRKEVNLVYVLLSIALVIILMWGVTLFILEQTGITLKTQDQEPVIQETTAIFACESNRECFIAGCKSKTITECVNILGMENYYMKCEAWWDVRVEKQDFSKCACINGFCKAQ